MTKEEFDALCMECVAEVRKRCPRESGNLVDHGVKFIWLNDSTFQIYVEESEAPYMPFTNEPWVAERWHSKKNPNEAWWQDATRLVVELLKSKLKGKVK